MPGWRSAPEPIEPPDRPREPRANPPFSRGSGRPEPSPIEYFRRTRDLPSRRDLTLHELGGADFDIPQWDPPWIPRRRNDRRRDATRADAEDRTDDLPGKPPADLGRWERYADTFLSTVVRQGMWLVAESAADLVHPGGRHLVDVAYQVLKVVRAGAGIDSGAGADMTVDVYDTGIDGLCVAVRLRRFEAGSGQLPHAGIGFDVSLIDPTTLQRPDGDGPPGREAPGPERVQVAGRWFDHLGRSAATDHELVLDGVRALPAGEAMAMLTRAERYPTSFALAAAMDETGETGTWALTYRGRTLNRRWPLPE